MKRFFKQIPTMKSKPLSHNKKHQLLFIDIGCACYLTHWAAWYYFLFIRKHKYFLPVRNNWVVVCNLTDVRYSVSFNGIKWLVTLKSSTGPSFIITSTPFQLDSSSTDKSTKIKDDSLWCQNLCGLKPREVINPAPLFAWKGCPICSKGGEWGNLIIY